MPIVKCKHCKKVEFWRDKEESWKNYCPACWFDIIKPRYEANKKVNIKSDEESIGLNHLSNQGKWS